MASRAYLPTETRKYLLLNMSLDTTDAQIFNTCCRKPIPNPQQPPLRWCLRSQLTSRDAHAIIHTALPAQVDSQAPVGT